MKSKNKLTKGDSILIEGSRWFQKTYGNTYCSARIYVNNNLIKVIPMTYGYGSFYRQISLEYLVKHGYISDSNTYSQEEKGIIIYDTVRDVRREKDLDHEDVTADKVKFIKFNGEVLAVFPDLINPNNGLMTCYAHLGQHSECDTSFYRKRKASKEEYSGLLAELKNIGYENLKILN